ncbi:hypothetical protein [Cellulomonas sp. GbtcB1]|uniref:hypothetical protein n=1 Tax=Cellulomonas sp. GbtcB1 TaxID=2824746 RepID=UPI001C30CCE5|nr:hypothetical protein [Cellulomonas sp. GbtcB1]
MLWDDRFASSQAWPALEQCRTLIDASEMPEDGTERDALAYVGWVIELLEKRRSETDPHEITPTMLNNVAAASSALAQHIELVNNGSYSWSQITPQADAVLDSLAAWPPMKIAHYVSGLSSATEGFQIKASQAIDEVSARADSANERLEALQQTQTQLGESIEAERQRISEAIADFNTESADTLTGLRNESQSRIEAFLEKWDTQSKAADDRAAETLSRLDALEQQARNVVHATTSLIVATDYGTYARNKTIAAWTCDIAAALVGAAGLAVIVYHLLSINPDADANVGLSLTRLAVSLGTLGIATLLGRRGQQHHIEARAAKRTDLALRQVLPFTANLPDEDRQQIVREFTDRVFIRGDLDSPPQTSRPRWTRRPRQAADQSSDTEATK